MCLLILQSAESTDRTKEESAKSLRKTIKDKSSILTQLKDLNEELSLLAVSL